MEKVKIELKIDDREDNKILNIIEKTKIKEYIRKLKVDIVIKKERLLVGDYVANNICIERKSFEDFIESVRNKRLYEQLLNMQENYEHNYLIIIGNIKDIVFNPHIKYTVNEYIGTIASLLTRFTTTIYIVNNNAQFVKLVLKIIEKNYSDKVVGIIKRIPITKKDREIAVLCCIEGVGEEKAKLLLGSYKLRDIFNKKQEELMKIRGIGCKIAENILNLMSPEL